MDMLREIAKTMLSGHTVRQKWNYLRYRASHKKEVLGYGPVTISIVATSRCTLACDMCPTHSGLVPKDYMYAQNNMKDMTFGMFKEMIDAFKDALTINIIGSGEPLLNKDFFRMVDYAAFRKMKVKTFSNGTTVADNIDKLLKSRLNGITISINGHNAKEFRRMTGMDEAAYSKIYNGVKALIKEKKRRASKLKVKLSFIIDRYNYRFIPEMIELGRFLDVDHIFFCNFLPSPYDGLRSEERLLTANEPLKNELKAIFKNCRPDMKRKVTAPVLVDIMEKGKNRCDSHFNQIRFDGDGNVSSCSMMLLNMTGHGTYEDKDAWNNAFFRKMRRLFLSGRGEDMPGPCRVCPDNKGVKI